MRIRDAHFPYARFNDVDLANTGAEEFGEYVQRVPARDVGFGSQSPGRDGYPVHSSRFDVDEHVSQQKANRDANS